MIGTAIGITIFGVIFGVPLALSVSAGVAAGLLIFDPTDLINIANLFVSNINDLNLLAIPLLILVGAMVSEANMIEPIIRVCELMLRRVKGGMALVSVGSAVFFAGSTGSSAAETSMLANALHRPLQRRGYSPEFTGALIAASGVLGILFPPCIVLIIYSSIVGYPVTLLWKAALVPGAIGVVMLGAVAVALGRRYESSDEAEPPPPVTAKELIRGIPCLLLPVIVIGGIFSGIVTLSETAAVAFVYVIAYGLISRQLPVRRLSRALVIGGRQAGAIFFIVIAAKTLSFYLVSDGTSQQVITWVDGLGLHGWALLAVIDVAVLVLGILVDSLSLIIIIAPILATLLQANGVSLAQLGVLLAVTIEIGVIHPPFGMNIFAVSAVMDVAPGRVALRILPFVGVLLVLLFIVTYVHVPIFQWG
jgi:C4-dicarboxylate transporter, DctM subunit